MQEQQGSLTPELSGLPGPRPFNKKRKTKMENQTHSHESHEDGKPDMSKPTDATVDEIVARTAKAIGAGKAFGGWTDDVEEQVRQGATIKVKLGKGVPAGGSYKEKVSGSDLKAAGDVFDRLRGGVKQGKPFKAKLGKPVRANEEEEKVDEIWGAVSKVADVLSIGRGLSSVLKKKKRNEGVKEASDVKSTMARVKKMALAQAKKAANAPLVKIGPDSTRKNPQYTKTIRPSDLKKNESVEQIDEIAPLIGAALGAVGRIAGSAVGKKVIGHVGRHAAGAAVGKMFKKNKTKDDSATTYGQG